LDKPVIDGDALEIHGTRTWLWGIDAQVHSNARILVIEVCNLDDEGLAQGVTNSR